MTIALIAIIAFAALLLFLVIVELITWAGKVHFFSSVILGEDGRTSTSKTFIFMWTLLVTWALAALLIAGEFVHRHGCVPSSYTANAAQMCMRSHDDVGLLQVGWLQFLHAGLSGSYLILLGVPAAAGVAAKDITQRDVNGSGFKAKITRKRFDPFARLAEIFSADDGSTDIADFQYLIFNLITGVYFVTQFLKPTGSGLPTIPDTLLGLTGVSASLYVGKKAVTQTQPTVTGVFPQPLHDGQTFTVVGTSLTVDPASPSDVPPQITIGGVPATAVVATPNGELVANAPQSISSGGQPVIRQLQVKNPYGGITTNFDVQCS